MQSLLPVGAIEWQGDAAVGSLAQLLPPPGGHQAWRKKDVRVPGSNLMSLTEQFNTQGGGIQTKVPSLVKGRVNQS